MNTENGEILQIIGETFTYFRYYGNNLSEVRIVNRFFDTLENLKTFNFSYCGGLLSGLVKDIENNTYILSEFNEFNKQKLLDINQIRTNITKII